jgi:hypothetical protein
MRVALRGSRILANRRQIMPAVNLWRSDTASVSRVGVVSVSFHIAACLAHHEWPKECSCAEERLRWRAPEAAGGWQYVASTPKRNLLAVKSSIVSSGVQRQTAVTIGSLGVEASFLAEAKTMGVAPPAVFIPVGSQVERERVLRLYAQGLHQIEIGNVYAARQFFELAANAGLCRSAVALAGMYDLVRLAKLKVLGGQPDFEAAVKWYKKAHDLCAIDALTEKVAIPTTVAASGGTRSTVGTCALPRRSMTDVLNRTNIEKMSLTCACTFGP